MLRTALSFALRAADHVVGLAIVSGVVLLTFASPSAAQSTTQTRGVSCAGLDFRPIDSRTTFAWEDRVLFRRTRDGDGWFFCTANLPHRAVVNRVRFTVKDSYEDIEVRYCALIRTPLALTGAIQVLGMVGATGLDASPGIVRRTDTSISFATIDNLNYAYSLQCQIAFGEHLAGIGTALAGIIGADVTFTITAANG